ncbi:DEAD/DEAH box helicase [Companilactobacillus sp. DQM5]|uniref:DEAD/DEAH box helicase n=1 Tax=Companilactobacillus sp. DQM5 TaxID=3463359 RepID=UPI004058DC59
MEKQTFINSVLSSFIDEKYISSNQFEPQLITNSSDENIKAHINQELQTCTGFTFAVAFISNSVLTDLKVLFADLHTKGISGRILTSTYLAFNQPKVFSELFKIPNVDVKIMEQEENFHAKGYIFDHENYKTIILGSSNLTTSALISNYEWNIKFSSLDNSKLTNQFLSSFENQWKKAQPLTANWIRNYTDYFKKLSFSRVPVANFTTEIVPNNMQKEALLSLQNLRSQNVKKALIISATGTGKTYLGAFDVQQFNPKRFLFVVHREQILKKSLESFHKILGGSLDSYGIFSGSSKDRNHKYLFATIQSISQDKNLAKFKNNEFDYILIDEAHKSGAKSYQKIINYFTPNFLLGMTATPERTDDFNIYELFDYNIAYEIRLQNAIEENMLSPFHYIGIVDYEYQSKTIEEKTPLKYLVSEERMNYVINQLDYYGYSGEKVHGLIFCSRIDEAKEIANIMTSKGHPSVALTGEDSISTREKTISRFEKGKIEYIVTVDIFNEGIDIPKINQIVMLRNTESSIIFIQQLGRGLRKYPNKEFVTIIDFIGNYKNNYLIPIALSGDKTLNKNNLRNKIAINQVIGLSSINFSEIARQKIYNSINNNNLTLLNNLRSSYIELKNKIGRIPLLQDFQKFGTVDPQVFVDKYESYYDFLIKLHESKNLTNYEQCFLKLISKEFLNGMRAHDLVLIKELLSKESITKTDYISQLKKLNTYVNKETITSVENHLTLDYYQDNDKKKYGQIPFLKIDNNIYTIDSKIFSYYISNKYFKSLVDDVIKVGLSKNHEYAIDKQLTIGKKYTRRQVNNLIGWPKDQSSSIYGYKEKYNICPIFITYQKNEMAINKYNHTNTFFNPSTISWYSKNRRTLESNEIKNLFKHNKNNETLFLLFIKKSDDEGSDFYYLGPIDFDFNSIEQQINIVKNKEVSVVKANLILRNPVNYDLFLKITK